MILNIVVDNERCVPVRAHPSDAGADLVTKEDVKLDRKIRTLVKTGVKVEVPVGYVGLIFPRSSLSKDNIIMTNSVGVIDSDYRGEIMASLMYTGVQNSIHIHKFTRIVQLVIVPIQLANFNIVDKLEDTARGAGGFGSTG
jgi:dUTP pyrophosphatase